MDILIAHEADLNIRDMEGITPIMAAAHQYKPVVVEHLLRAGAHVDVLDDQACMHLHPYTMFVCDCLYRAMLRSAILREAALLPRRSALPR